MKNIEHILPKSIAIAGIYGYIGNLIYQAALELGIRKVYGFDPGVEPNNFLYSPQLEMLTNEEYFYNLNADLFHIATHPNIRYGIFKLLTRKIKINVEKPVCHPAYPQEALKLIEAVKNSASTVYFNFVEVFNPRTFKIIEILDDFRQYNDFKLNYIYSERAKNREYKDNERNYKVIVPIQYQETCHCLAMALYILTPGYCFKNLFRNGIKVKAFSEKYNPPNPQDYKYGEVDGKVIGQIRMDNLLIEIYNDFKRKDLSRPLKKFLIQGVANNQPFVIKQVYDGFQEYLLLNDHLVEEKEEQNRHKNTITYSWYLHQKSTLFRLKPDVEFAWLVFRLSATIWQSCFENRTVEIKTEKDMIEAVEFYPKYLQNISVI
ncbi:MAG: hypothetical protein F6K54_24565 [Okeania sp. SIO3B5]|uniref:hypothetical protein n=1 Tax=Okeania sp. SIO3B5 TaxID=2607811 RepID=UPI0013FF0E17|nr:hypothetical protein [Okeania sp. SIO3B5]NEO55960.1 hypothetical protein [Okeania sp. SIO3B5]